MRRQKMRQIQSCQVGILISAKKFQNLFTSSKKTTSELSVFCETTIAAFFVFVFIEKQKVFSKCQTK
jgi:hypothetical protein